MSTVIIAGGSGTHSATTRLIVVYPHATADQQARIKSLLEQFTADAEALANEVDANPLRTNERALDTVDERIKDAVHTRVKMGDYMKFSDEVRQAINKLQWDLKDGLHERLRKTEFDEFKREIQGRNGK